MEQNREPRNRPTKICPTDFFLRRNNSKWRKDRLFPFLRRRLLIRLSCKHLNPRVAHSSFPPGASVGGEGGQTLAGSIARPSTPRTRGPLRTKKETRFAGRCCSSGFAHAEAAVDRSRVWERRPAFWPLLGVPGSFRGQDFKTLFTGFGGNQQDPVFPTGSTHQVAVVHSPTAGGNYAKPVD